MKHTMDRVREFLVREDGPTAAEYGVMLVLIVFVALAAISGIGTKVAGMFTSMESALPPGS
jgi:pilus assembly protein Flp/PilA